MDPRRRAVLVAGACAFAFPAFPASPARIAYIGPGSAKNYTIFLDALREGLREQGMVEGRDYAVDVHWLEGRYDRIPAVLQEVMRRKPQVIVPGTILAVSEAKKLTSTVPIVMPSINDPVAAGLIASLSRPGTNVTGVANLAEDTSAKLVQLLHTALPSIRRLGFIVNPRNPQNRRHADSATRAAEPLGLEVSVAEFRQQDGIGGVIAALVEARCEAILLGRDGALLDLREEIVEAAFASKLPVFSTQPEFATAGAVIGFGASVAANYKRSARYVKRVLSGENPANLPVEQPLDVRMEVNLRSARALDLSLPTSLLLQASRIVE